MGGLCDGGREAVAPLPNSVLDGACVGGLCEAVESSLDGVVRAAWPSLQGKASTRAPGHGLQAVQH